MNSVPYLQGFDFPHLFVEGLGWDYYQAEPLALTVDGHEYTHSNLWQKRRSFAVFECSAAAPMPMDSRFRPKASAARSKPRVAQAKLRAPDCLRGCRPKPGRSGSGSSANPASPPAIPRTAIIERGQTGRVRPYCNGYRRHRVHALDEEEGLTIGITDVTGKIRAIAGRRDASPNASTTSSARS